MYNLFLDDLREPYLDPIEHRAKIGIENFDFLSTYHYTKWAPFKDEEWVVVRTHADFIRTVTDLGLPEKVAFDHDLGDEHYVDANKLSKNTKIIDYSNFQEKTGYDSAKWLCGYCAKNQVKFPEYYIHSWNKVGAINIQSYIENYKKHVENE